MLERKRGGSESSRGLQSGIPGSNSASPSKRARGAEASFGFEREYQLSPDCHKHYTFGQHLWTDAYAAYYATCATAAAQAQEDGGTDCAYVVKVVPLQSSVTNRRQFIRSAILGERMAQAGVGPPVRNYWICPAIDSAGEYAPLGFVVFYGLGRPLAQVLVENPKSLLPFVASGQFEKRLQDKLERVLDAGYTHLDLSPENIVLEIDKRSGAPVDVFIADFTQLRRLKPVVWSTELEIPLSTKELEERELQSEQAIIDQEQRTDQLLDYLQKKLGF